MSYWNFVKALIIFVALLVLLTPACGQKDGLRSEITNAIDKMSGVDHFRSTVNRIAITDSYVQSQSVTAEYSGMCSYHMYEITVENRAGNVTTGPFGKNWYLEPGASTEWQESILINGKGYWRSSTQPEWRLSLVDCVENSGPLLNSEFYLYTFLGSIKELPAEDIGNVSCKRYKVDVDYDSYIDNKIEKTKKLYETPIILTQYGGNISFIDWMEMTRQNEAVAEFWIDEEGYIRQLKSEKRSLVDPIVSKDEWTEVTVIRYSDFNQPITIEPPPVPPSSFPTPTPTPSPP